jgi:hypothetical protein
MGDGRAAANWYADPSGRFEQRFWDGARWTTNVARSGQAFIDVLTEQPRPPPSGVEAPASADAPTAASPAGRDGRRPPTWAQVLAAGAVVVLVVVAVGIGAADDTASKHAASGARDVAPSPLRERVPSPVTNAPPTTVPVVGTHVELPIPKGAAIPASPWKFTIVDFRPDATADVLRLSPANRTPPLGEHYAALRVHADYLGAGMGNPRLAPSIDLIGLLHVSYRPASVASGAGGDAGQLRDSASVPSGGSTDGWVYYLVSDEDGGLVCWVPNDAHTIVPGAVAFFAIQ